MRKGGVEQEWDKQEMNELRRVSMKKIWFTVFVVFLFSFLSLSSGQASGLDDMLKGAKLPGQMPSMPGAGPDNKTTASGLKEALEIGTSNAVKAVSKTDGYFGNQVIKILLPDNVQKMADVLGKVGYQKQVDDFVLSMNRAAEKAAPQATALFVDAIKSMTFEDARKILQGGDTAATDFFKAKTSAKLRDAFKPIVSSTMNQVGVTRHIRK